MGPLKTTAAASAALDELSPWRMRAVLGKPPALAAAASGIVVFGYSFFVLTLPYDQDVEKLVSSAAIVSLCALFAALGLALARKTREDRRLSRSWLMLSAAAGLWGAGEIVWAYYESVLEQDPVFSLVDVFFVPFYPLTLLAVLLFPFAPVSKVERTILTLDLAIVVVAASMVLWYFILAPAHLAGPSDPTRLITLFYALASVPILAGVVALIQRDVERVARPALSLLAAGFTCIVVGNSFFAYFEINHVRYSMSHLNMLWLLALQFLITGAAWQSLTEARLTPLGTLPEEASPRLLQQALPYLGIFIGLALLALGVTSPSGSRHALHGVLAGTFVQALLVSVRQQVVQRDNIRLYKETQRLRLAQEIHDHISQIMTGLILQLDAGRDALGAEPPAARAYLERARQLAREGLEETRRTARDLRDRPTMPDGDLKDVLQRSLGAIVAGTSVRVDVSERGIRFPVARSLEAELFRVAQEAVTNALRHGRAHGVEIDLCYEEQGLRLSVRDDGLGFDPEQIDTRAGLGLRGMLERVERQGGTLDVESRPGQGAVVRAFIPRVGRGVLRG